MSSLLPYLVVPLFFTADYTASEETLAAGVAGYQKRAEAARKSAVSGSEELAKAAAAKLAAVRRGRIDASLVGTTRSPGVERNGTWTFGTATERAEMIALLARRADYWKQHAADLRAKTIWPAMPFFVTYDGITPGAVGAFGKKTLAEIRDIDQDRVSAGMTDTILRDLGAPVIQLKHGVSASVVIEHGGKDVNLHRLYQFVGTKDGSAFFRLVESMKVGAGNPD